MKENEIRLQALKALLELNPLVHKHLFSRIKKTIRKVNRAQFLILSFLVDNGDTGMSVLADRVGVSSSQLTGLIGELEEAGYVVRQTSPVCRRAVNVSMTPVGREYVSKEREKLNKAMLPLFDRLTYEEVCDLKSCSERISKILNSYDNPEDKAGT